MPTKIFISYAGEDSEFLKELKKHLFSLQREGLAEIWHTGEISGGQNKDQEIERHLQAADLILLLISVDFLDSSYLYEKLLPEAVQQKQRGARVIPIILRPVFYKFGLLENLQALPRDERPISRWDNQDQAYKFITDDLRMMLLQNEMEEENLEEKERNGALDSSAAVETEKSMMVLYPKELDECQKLFDSALSKWLLMVTGLDGVGKSTFLEQFQKKYAKHIGCTITLNGGQLSQKTGGKVDKLEFLYEISYSTAIYCNEEEVRKVEKGYEDAHKELIKTIQNRVQQMNPNDHVTNIQDLLEPIRDEFYELVFKDLIQQLSTFEFSSSIKEPLATKYLLIILDGYEQYSLSEFEELIQDPLARIHKRIEDRFIDGKSSLRCLVVGAHRLLPSLDEGQIKDNEKACFSLPLVERGLVEKYLQYYGVADENENFDQIYTCTQGHPLCLSIFKETLSLTDASEQMHAFYGKAWRQWIKDRMTKYMDDKTKKMLSRVAFAPYFSEKILIKVLKLDRWYRNFEYNDFIKLSCISEYNGTMEQHVMHPLVQTVIAEGLKINHPTEYRICEKSKHRFQCACKSQEQHTIFSYFICWWQRIFL